MSSGISVDPQCQLTYNELKLKKKLKFIIFRVSDDKGSIIVDENTGKQSTESDEEDKYNDFVALLPKTSPGSQSEPRWAVYDLEYEKDGGKRNKLVFIIWSPEDAKVGQKMLYASSKDALRRSLDGISAEHQATDLDEIAFGAVKEKADRNTR